MRRIDAILIALVVFLIGGLAYIIFQFLGIEAATAGIWSQGLLVVGLIGWITTYLFRVFTNDMTYHKQVKDYEDAFFAKQLEKMSPEEIEQLMAEKE
ncbi:MAG: DUF3007 family protein [Cyanobacteria bacterium]|nr:DUF3007 family protein [Cyanobacteria bacterium CG_2015-16_32_12]NCO77568.1 DUF3007 family protein [Cyanobacteria bacterium CG_2015-22_32_23]NCQ03564.1 DUF3007 family protein [Cyanobacteria bacterium CG_2015-09_32_10]NCS84855.1 DUF3007 family protein [Cyanobacteria bacterium CG_2015-02_32_10]